MTWKMRRIDCMNCSGGISIIYRWCLDLQLICLIKKLPKPTLLTILWIEECWKFEKGLKKFVKKYPLDNIFYPLDNFMTNKEKAIGSRDVPLCAFLYPLVLYLLLYILNIFEPLVVSYSLYRPKFLANARECPTPHCQGSPKLPYGGWKVETPWHGQQRVRSLELCLIEKWIRWGHASWTS